MWLSTILVSTYGLLLVHYVSVVSCSNYRSFSSFQSWDDTPPALGGTESWPYRWSQQKKNPPRTSTMTSVDALREFSDRGATMVTGPKDADLDRAFKNYFEQRKAKPQTSYTYESTPPQRMISTDVRNTYNGFQVDLKSNPWNSFVVRGPTREEWPSSYSPKVSPYSPYYTPTVPQYETPKVSPSYSSYTPTVPQYGTPRVSDYGVRNNPARTSPNRRLGSGFSSTGSSSDLYPGQSNVPQNSSPSKSTPNVIGAPLNQPLTSNVVDAPFTPTSSSDFSTLFGNPSTPTLSAPSTPTLSAPSTKPLPSTVSAPSTKPLPSTSSSQTNSMNNSPQPVQKSSAAPVKKEYKYAADGRRIAGRQTELWPKLGGWNDMINAGKKLGPKFEGILIPDSYIPAIEEGLESARNRTTMDDQGLARIGNFALNWDKQDYEDMDVDLIKKAIREELGDDDDWDNPDPWTYDSIYSSDVLELNKKLHNEYRARHYAQPLEYMDAIHPVAHGYANYLAKKVSLEGLQYFDHNYDVLKKNRWSENLYTSQSEFDGVSPAKLVRQAIEGWYEEKNRYAYFGKKNADIFKPALTGHFTTLVWRGSKRMGLGIAKHRNPAINKTQYVVVVNYDPAGNVPDGFDTNVRQEGNPPSASDDAQESPTGGALGGLFGL